MITVSPLTWKEYRKKPGRKGSAPSKIPPDLVTDVVLEKISSPDKTNKELAEEYGIAASTVGKMLKKEMPKLARYSDRIQEVVHINNGLLAMVDEKLFIKLKNNELENKELISLKDLVTKQNNLIEGIGRQETVVDILPTQIQVNVLNVTRNNNNE